MTKINFFIPGNQESSTDNPIPYMRSTKNAQWLPKVIRYNEWKGYVQKKYVKALEELTKSERSNISEYHDLTEIKPIKNTKAKIRMDIMVFWKDNTHGDCDNVWKGIADALFKQDKYAVGSFDYQYPPDKKGGVAVTIYFPNE